HVSTSDGQMVKRSTSQLSCLIAIFPIPKPNAGVTLVASKNELFDVAREGDCAKARMDVTLSRIGGDYLAGGALRHTGTPTEAPGEPLPVGRKRQASDRFALLRPLGHLLAFPNVPQLNRPPVVTDCEDLPVGRKGQRRGSPLDAG